MSPRRAAFLCAAALALTTADAAPAEEEAAARKSATDLAASLPPGFKLREGQWCGPLAPDESPLIQVNLYAGNEYRFLVGATSGVKSLGARLYDETGRPVAAQPTTPGNAVALSFAPEASGPYYLKIEEPEGDLATFCLIYSYK